MRRYETITSFPYKGVQLEFGAYGGPVTRQAVERMIQMLTITLECFDDEPKPEQPEPETDEIVNS